MDEDRLSQLEQRLEELDKRSSSMERAMDRAMDRSRAAMDTMIPAETRRHVRAAWRENLLAVRSLIDFWADRLDEGKRSERASDGQRSREHPHRMTAKSVDDRDPAGRGNRPAAVVRYRQPRLRRGPLGRAVRARPADPRTRASPGRLRRRPVDRRRRRVLIPAHRAGWRNGRHGRCDRRWHPADPSATGRSAGADGAPAGRRSGTW